MLKHLAYLVLTTTLATTFPASFIPRVAFAAPIQEVASGNHDKLLAQAEDLMRSGSILRAQEIYKLLLAANPQDLPVYISRATMLIAVNDTTGAEADITTAMNLLPKDKSSFAQRQQIHATVAGAFIRAGMQSQAILVLQPYITDNTATTFMQCDYMLALRINGDYATAIKEGLRMWPDTSKIPLYGVQALADAYIRSLQPQKAIPIYEDLLKRSPDLAAVKLSLAYAYMSTGQNDKALTLYDTIISENPNLANIVIDDAIALVGKGRYHAAKQLFTLVTNKYPTSRSYRQEFASALFEASMPREAYRQYNILSTVNGGELAGSAGMVRTATMAEAYGTAKIPLDVLTQKYGRDAIAAQAINDYDNRRRGSAGIGYRSYTDYKGNDFQVYQLTADQALQGNLAVLTSITSNRLTDKTTDEKTTLNSKSIGLQYSQVKYNAKAVFHFYNNSGSFTGYHLSSNYYFSDHAILRFGLSRSPFEDVQALDPNQGGRVMVKTTSLGFTRQIGPKNTYDVDVAKSSLSDGNKSTDVSLRYSRTLLATDKKSLNWFVFGSRLSYAQQTLNGVDTVYESPSARVAYGTGLISRWYIPKGYWDATATLSWGSDRPEPTDFSPYFRIEYGHYFSPTRLLVIGAGYGLRTDRGEGTSSLLYGYREYDINYRVYW